VQTNITDGASDIELLPYLRIEQFISGGLMHRPIGPTGILKHDTQFAVHLFRVANGAVFMQTKLGFTVTI